MKPEEMNAILSARGQKFRLPPASTVHRMALRQEQAKFQKKNEPTLARWGATWILNTLENIKTITSVPNLEPLVGLFKGEPGILVSPGPSLRNNWERLKGGVRIGGTRSMRYTHMTMLVDAGEKIPFEKDLVPKCELFLGAAAINPLFFHYPWKRTVTFAGNQDLEKWLYGAALDSGGSVACSAASLLRIMGCDPIILVGQDLSYGETLYDDGTRLEGKQWVRNGEVVCQRQPEIVMEGYSGGMVKSTEVLQIYRDWFSSRALELKKREDPVRLWNCTEGGANIEGWENRDLEPQREVDVAGRIQEALDGYDVHAWRHRAHEAIRKVLDTLDDVWRICSECKGAIRQKRTDKLDGLELELQEILNGNLLIGVPNQEQLWHLNELRIKATTEEDILKAMYRLYDLLQRNATFLKRPLKRALR